MMAAKSALPAYAMNQSSFPWTYERVAVGSLFRPWAEVLLDRAELGRGMSVLDVACGTGIVARLARERGAGSVVGVDASPPMLEVAREVAPDIDWRQGDAAALPVAAGERFDRVLCQQGLQFFADRTAAAREFRRVLAPGGRLLAAVWRGAREMPVFDALQRAAERYVGPIHDQRHAYGDSRALEEMLLGAGLRDVHVDVVSLEHRFDAGEFVRLNATALMGMSDAKLSEEQRRGVLEEIVSESRQAASQFIDGDVLVCEMRSNIVTAR